MKFAKQFVLTGLVLAAGVAAAYPGAGRGPGMNNGMDTAPQCIVVDGQCPFGGPGYGMMHGHGMHGHMMSGPRGAGFGSVDCPYGNGFRGRGVANPEQAQANFNARMESLAGMLKLSKGQSDAWDKYVQARNELRSVRFTERKPVVDVQGRFERRLEVTTERRNALQKVVDARKALIEQLSPEQRYVLEGVEGRMAGRFCR